MTGPGAQAAGEAEATRYGEMSPEQQVHFGQLAEDAFNNPLFMTWFQLEMMRTVEAIDAAPPDHTKEVMWQKCKRQVLREMAQDFTGLIAQARRIISEQQYAASPEGKEADRLDTQGFGFKYDDNRGRS